MIIEIKTPVLPESVADATVLLWHKQPGEPVAADELLVEIETDKVVLEVVSPVDGTLETIAEPKGTTVNGKQLLGTVLQGDAPTAVAQKSADQPTPQAKPAPATPDSAPATGRPQTSPSVRRMLAEHEIDPQSVQLPAGQSRITQEDIAHHLETPASVVPATGSGAPSAGRMQQRVPMTRLRARIAERLLQATNQMAMLTTFNEIDMSALMTLRTKFKQQFEDRHGVKLGMMSMFIKASAQALQQFPEINASIDGNDVIYNGFCDIGVAIGSERGLVVPILRDAENLSLAQIEQGMVQYIEQANTNTLSIDSMTGGTFTISNGGVFGSLLSTPIINPPQSAILGMHTIQKRAVVVDDQIVIRPMMYVALSYDHRIVDGKGAVTFLKTIKQLVEDPALMLLDT